MVKWEKHRLGDVIELIGGGTPKTSVPEYWNGGIPWLSVKDFGSIIFSVWPGTQTSAFSDLKIA